MADVARITRSMTADAVALAHALATTGGAWGTRVEQLDDWWAVLCGPGFYVNRLEGGGVERPLRLDQLVEFERLAREVGVPAAVAVVDVGHPGTETVLAERGYQKTGSVTVGVSCLDGAAVSPLDQADFTLETVHDHAGLERWQRVAAQGWGHTTQERRHISDEFARAAMLAVGSMLMVVRDAIDDREVATCSLAIRDGLATLGGMSVLPSERRRGVQAAAIALRLEVARRAGCDLAVTSTASAGDSERNVRRHGFEYSHTVTTWTTS